MITERKFSLFSILVMAFAIMFMTAACDNPNAPGTTDNSGNNNGGGNGSGEETENADWWIGTWESIEHEYEGKTYYFKLTLDGNGTDYSSGSYVFWFWDNVGNIIEWDTGDVITNKDYTLKGTWYFYEGGSYDGIAFENKDPFELLYMDYDRKQLSLGNDENKEYLTKK